MKQTSKRASLFCVFPRKLSLRPSVTVFGQFLLTREPSRGLARSDLMEELVDVDIDLLDLLLYVKKQNQNRM
jgi:hypothetical protein